MCDQLHNPTALPPFKIPQVLFEYESVRAPEKLWNFGAGSNIVFYEHDSQCPVHR